jgi:cell division protein FtsW (lipid II flippase)
MFDEIPKPSKALAARTRAWLGIGVAVVWLLVGAGEVARHSDIWWLMIAVWAFILLVWIRRLAGSWQDDGQEKQTEKLNG